LQKLPFVGPILVAMSDGDPTTDPYNELARGTGQGLAAVVLSMPTIGANPMLVGSPTPTGWPEEMTNGLRTVNEVVRETLDLLLPVLPVGTAPRRS
jgi:hypothetical protein